MKYTRDMIIERFNNKEDINYIFFWGHTPSKNGKITKACLSQWWKQDFKVDNLNYWCMEQYMMAEKAKLFGDDEIYRKIIISESQKEIKELGRIVKGFNEDIWIQHRYDIVLRGNLEKFSQNDDIRRFILSTGDSVLVEASPYDKIWGIGKKADDKDIKNPINWDGLNLLGFALMEVRDEMR